MKKLTYSLSFVLALALAFVIEAPAFGQTIVPNTTLAAAITSTSSQANTFKLTSTSGITAGNTVIFIDGEADFVNAVTTTPATVTVTRGAGPSTRVSTHANGAVVWYGPPSYFQSQTPAGYPFGSCSRTTALVLPYIDINNNIISDCLGGVWVQGVTTNSIGNTQWRVQNVANGYIAYTSLGTDTATTNTIMYCSELDLPVNKYLTGIAILNGATVGNGHRQALLYDAAGNLLAKSASGSNTTAGANTFQAYAFSTPFFAVGPAQYFTCTTSANSTDSVRMLVTTYSDNVLAGYITGLTYGTSPAKITPPSSFTTVEGPYSYVY